MGARTASGHSLGEQQATKPDGYPTTGRDAVVVMESFAGITRHPCVVVGETPKRYRVRMKQRTRLPRCRWVYAGELTTVPKHAIDFV